MTAERLDSASTAKLRAARLTYPEAGRTAGSLPAGYRTFVRTAQLPAAVDFDTAAHDLLHWQVQRRAGLFPGLLGLIPMDGRAPVAENPP